MKTFYDPLQLKHDPQFFLVRGKQRTSAEKPERVSRFLSALDTLGMVPQVPDDFGAAARTRVHTPDYLRFLQHAWAEWQNLPDSSNEVVANVFANRYAGNYPESVVGRAGWHMADTACPIGEHTWSAACASANTALSAAECLLQGEQSAYALCRPPGHHAFADMAGGFCFLNNVAIAAEHLLPRFSKVTILDVDVHHGNGTQGIFYQRSDVLTISTHTDPASFYPFHWGHANEKGEGDGDGYNINLRLPMKASGDQLIDTVATLRPQIESFNPGVLLVALGLDTSEEDPLQGMMLNTADFARLGSTIAAFNVPTLYVQEGGYLSESLSANLASFLSGVRNQS